MHVLFPEPTLFEAKRHSISSVTSLFWGGGTSSRCQGRAAELLCPMALLPALIEVCATDHIVQERTQLPEDLSRDVAPEKFRSKAKSVGGFVFGLRA